MPQPDSKLPAGMKSNSVQALILDMDGVLWRGNEPIGDLPKIFERISHIGWKVIFATNNGSRTIDQYIELLASFGVRAEPWQVITSAVAAVDYLCSKLPGGGPVFIIGEQGILEACQQHGYHPSDTGARAVVVGIDRQLTYDKLKIATLMIRAGVPFIGTNPDKTFPTPLGLVPGAGAILAALEAATSVPPVIVGKPEPAMYQIALERLKIQPGQALVVGDRPETDIAGAQLLGCRTALLLSGVTDAGQARRWQPPPDIIAPDLQSLLNLDWEI